MMRQSFLSVLFSSFLVLCGCSTTSSILGGMTNNPQGESTTSTNVADEVAAMTWGLTLVKENFAVLNVNSETYVVDSYIVPFKQPYYILVRKQNGEVERQDVAEIIAIEYIKPRGCTEPLQRRADLDRKNADGSIYIFGVQC